MHTKNRVTDMESTDCIHLLWGAPNPAAQCTIDKAQQVADQPLNVNLHNHD